MQEALAALVAEPPEMPAAALEAAATFLLDTLAIGVAGRGATYREELATVARTWGDGGACIVLGERERYPAATAAFLNTFQMHCLEFDCVHEAAVAHVMTAPVGVALAEIAARPISGNEFLRALVIGVEVAVVLGLAANAPLTFFRPATTGVFGAAATVAALRRYDAEQVLETFGYALAQAAGTMQAHEEGKPTLPIQLAGAARGGLIAADLAATGIPAPRQSVDGSFGFLSLFEREAKTDGLVEQLAQPWRVTELSHKPFPSGRATHGGVEAVLKLRAQGVSEHNLARMSLVAPPLIHQLVIRPATAEMNVNYARLCFPYAGAVALRRGALELGDFAAKALRDPQTLALAARFEAHLHDVADPAAFTPQRLTATLNDGRQLSVDVSKLLGSPDHPLDEQSQYAKVRACVEPICPGAAAGLIDAVRALASTDDVAPMLEPLTRGT